MLRKNETRKTLSAEIENMKKLDLNHMNIKDNIKVTANFKGITQRSLADSLQSVFNNDDRAQVLSKKLNLVKELKRFN